MFTFTKRLLLILLGVICSCMVSFAQIVRTSTLENFDGPAAITWSNTAGNNWETTSDYAVSGSNSYWGMVPNLPGDVSILESPVFNFANSEYVYLRFKHICKISPKDTVRIEYKIGLQAWKPIEQTAYRGSATNYDLYGKTTFNTKSYNDWLPNDSLAVPDATWWKQENFDISFETRLESCQIRFIIKRGNTQGTQISYGWLIDDLEVIQSSHPIGTPLLQFVNPPKGNVYSTGPYTLQAEIASVTDKGLHPIYLKWTHTLNSVTATDSVLMDLVDAKRNLYEAVIPQYLLGTQVTYSISVRDSNYNEGTISESYVISRSTGSDGEETITIGTGTASSPYALLYGVYDYSISRSIYLASEIGKTGQITSLSFYFTGTPGVMKNQTCWLAATDETVLTNMGSALSHNPTTDRATKVWTGDFNIVAGWNTLTLQTPFTIPPMKNLKLYWDNQEGSWTDNPAQQWLYTSMPNMQMFLYQDAAWFYPSGGGYSYTGCRPNMRLTIMSAFSGVGITSLNMPDTVAAPASIPIIVTIQNKDSANLTSATLYYSVDGGTPISKVWTGNLPWDFSAIDTIGYYSAIPNVSANIKAWISMPNGVADTTNWDDTLSKSIIAIADLMLSYEKTPKDTVNSVGPHEISISVHSFTGQTLPNMSIDVTIKNSLGSVVKTYSMPLANIKGNSETYTAYLQNIPNNHTAYYSFTVQDFLGNILTLPQKYTCVKSDAISIDSVTIGTGTVSPTVYWADWPWNATWNSGWCRIVYLHDEIEENNGDIEISKIAFYFKTTVAQSVDSLSFYMKATDDIAPVDASTYLNPITDGATLVWGSATATCVPNTWWEVTLDTTFVLPAGKNLLLYCTNFDGDYTTGGAGTNTQWECTIMPTPMATGYNDDNPNPFYFGMKNGQTHLYRPNMRVDFEYIKSTEANSLSAFRFSEPVGSTVMTGNSIPVSLIIRNRGTSVLTSCQVGWSLNGVFQNTISYTGSLNSDFLDTISLGSFIPTGGVYEIKAWVSLPNGQVDPIVRDDTIKKRVVTCSGSGGFTGNYIIGPSVNADFTTLEDALDKLQLCGMQDTVRFLLENGTHTINATIALDKILPDIMGYDDVFELASISGNADDVILLFPSTGFTLQDNRNVTLRGITIDVAQSTEKNGIQYGIQFLGACTNIMIRDCHILTQPNTTTTCAPIYKASGTGVVDSIFIINNLLDGGYYGLYFYGGTSTGSKGTNVVFDSNTVSNQYYYGVYSYYCDFISQSHNTILSRTTGAISSYWYGLMGYYLSGDVIGNRVYQRMTAIGYPYGIYLYYYYNGSSDTGRVINNEIRLMSSTAGYGMYIYYSRSYVINNSVYIEGGTSPYGLYIYGDANAWYEVKNNNFVMTGNGAYPIYLGTITYLSSWVFDNNNMYAPVNIGYANGPKVTLSAWQGTVTSDLGSITLKPTYVDANNSLEQIHYVGFGKPVHTFAREDINGVSRGRGTTSVGCYHGLRNDTFGLALKQIFNYRSGLIGGQSDTVKALLINVGLNSITGATIQWKYNGVLQAPVTYSGTIPSGYADSIVLGEINYNFEGINNLEAYISNISNGIDPYKGDDTTKVSFLICNSIMSGTYTVGVGGNFPTISDAIASLSSCGMNGDITLSIKSGTYEGDVSLQNLTPVANGYRLTLNSLAGNADSVIIKTPGNGIIIGNTKHVTVQNITVDATGGTHAIYFSDTCKDILIRDCKLLLDTLTNSTGYSVICTPTSRAWVLDSVFIINNLIEGGYYGIYLYGYSTAANGFNTNIRIDSNIIQKNYYYGMYSYYNDFISINANKIFTRDYGVFSGNWYGLVSYYGNGKITNNRVRASSNTAYPQCIYVYYLNRYNTTEIGLVANNECIAKTNGSYNGITFYYSRGKLLNNSVFLNTITPSTGAAMYVYLDASSQAEIKYNNLHVTGTTGRPIYVYEQGTLDIDYNNYYSKRIVGYGGTDYVSMSAWQSKFATDQHSVIIEPHYIDSTQSLKLSNYTGLSCPIHQDIDKDVEGAFRLGGSSTMGCYHGMPPLATNAALSEIINLREGVILGQTDTIKVRLLNAGSTTLTSVTLQWSFNGTIQPAVSWSGNLSYGQSTIVTLGTITYPAGNNIIKGWINSIGGLSDLSVADDTISDTKYTCLGALSGSYTVGSGTADFANFDALLQRLKLCGAGNDVTAKILPGTYYETINLTGLNSLMSGYKLEITSSTNNAEDVKFIVSNGGDAGLTLGASNNVVIRDITIDGSRGYYTVYFMSTCTNVVIRDCQILASPTTNTTGAGYGGLGIYKGSGFVVDSIFIIHNIIDGGYYNIYFYGSSTSAYNTHIVIDSNTISNPYYYSFLSYYNDFTSLSYNTVLSRTENTTTYWYGFYMFYLNGPIIGNRIQQRTTNITYPYGMYIYYYYNDAKDTGIIANNEVRVYTTSTYYGAVINYCNVHFLNNSIYVGGSNGIGVRAFYFTSGYYAHIENNNIVMEGDTAVPISIDANNLSRMYIDYNNYYAPARVGYASANKSSIAEWQLTVPGDLHSVSLLPSWLNRDANLDLADNTGLVCPALSMVGADIVNTPRSGSTTMGAWHYYARTADVQPIAFSNVNPTYPLGTSVPIKVKIKNTGTNTLTSVDIHWSHNGVSSVYSWTGSMVGDSVSGDITIGSITTVTGFNNIVVYTSNPNGVPDTRAESDTIKTTIYACDSMLNGYYTIGATGDIFDIGIAIEMAKYCGLLGPTTFAIQTGNYNIDPIVIDLTLPSSTPLTITSVSGQAGDVLLTSTSTGGGVRFQGASNINLQSISIDAKNGTSVVQFMGKEHDILIRDCRLISDTMSTATKYVIYKANGPISRDISIVHNEIVGGYYGIQLYGLNTSDTGMNENILIDSNLIINQYYYGIYLYYNDSVTLSYNTILSREDYAATGWYGIMHYYSNGPVIGNRIRQRTTSILYSYGIYLYYYHYYNHTDPSLVANNEIILYTTSSYYGMYLNSCHAKVINNSIYIDGTNGYGMYVSSGASGTSNEIKYNNIYMEGTSAYPIYIGSTSYLTEWDIDYNNYYAPVNIGYAGGAKATLSAWMDAVVSDVHSTNVQVTFVNTQNSLQMTSDMILICPVFVLLPYDINLEPRLGLTNKGAYAIKTQLDAAVASVDQTLNIAGSSSNLALNVQNLGLNNITSLEIRYSYNSVLQTPIILNGLTMAPSDIVNISLTPLVLNVGSNDVKIWVHSVNGGIDSLPENDTISLDVWGCYEKLHGTYTIGSTGNFSTIDKFLFELSTCGASADITLLFENGTHSGHLDLSSVADALGNYHLTIASQSGNASDVQVIALTGKPVVTLGNNKNIIIRNITLNNASSDAQDVIVFIGVCNNITIRNSLLLANQTTTTSGISIIEKANGTGIIDSLFIVGNVFNGGYYGIYMYGGNNNSNYGTNIVIDSNTFINQSAYGTYMYYTDLNSYAYNTFTSRSEGITTSATWYGTYMNYCNAKKIMYNRINCQSYAHTASYGFSLNYLNTTNTTDTALVANNDIMVRSSGASTGYGIDLRTVAAKVLHNSVLIKGNGNGNGIYIADAATNKLIVKNNNIALSSVSGCPMYITAIGNINKCDIDYNNLYAPQKIGYAAGTEHLTLRSWKNAITSDAHSVSTYPVYLDTNISLKVSTYAHLLAPKRSEVTDDIEKVSRPAQTLMGAYTQQLSTLDFMLTEVLGVDYELVNNQVVTVKVSAINPSTTAINNAVLGWSVNGVNQGSVNWTAGTPLATFGTVEIPIGTFAAPNTSNTIVKVWLSNVNGAASSNAWNDTVSFTATYSELAWLTTPYTADTVTTRTFDVYAAIMESTGALTVSNPPLLALQVTIGRQTIYDTVAMTFASGKWKASIPQQYYGSRVIYSLFVSDTVGNQITLKDTVFIKFATSSSKYTGNNLTINNLYGLASLNAQCLPDYTTLSLEVANTGNQDIDFSVDSLSVSIRVTQPITYSFDTVLTTGSVVSGKTVILDVADNFPLLIPGLYQLESWISNPADSMIYDDTLLTESISGRFGLPIDEDFSNGEMDMVFNSVAEVGVSKWKVISQGVGADSVIRPAFGDGILAFNGTPGSMSRLYTRQLDLSQTIQPNLTFWYYQDTVPCVDYMDVRVTTDGGATYTTMFSIRKYNPYFSGWRQYSQDLPLVGQCVFIVFEAMEKDRSGQTWQYVDRIRMTAKQDVELAEVYVTDWSACDMQNKEWKVVLKNNSDPVLNYGTTPIDVNLEIVGTGQVFSATKSSGVLGSFEQDTFVLSPKITFVPGTYTIKAYYTSIVDDNIANDTLRTTFVVNPHLHLIATQNTGGVSGVGCLPPDMKVQQEVKIINDGNLPIENFVLAAEVHGMSGVLQTVKDTIMTTLLVGDSMIYTINKEYVVPSEDLYNVVTYAYMLDCSAAYSDSSILTECADITDVLVSSLITPSGGKDTIGTQIRIKVRITNDGNADVTNVVIHAKVQAEDNEIYSQSTTQNRIYGDDYSDVEFATPYTVPSTDNYTIIVYLESMDNYKANDTLTVVRQTVSKPDDVPTINSESISLFQNIPNPASNTTKVEYSLPHDGKATFSIYTTAGQVIYTQSVDATVGKNNIIFDLNGLSSGIYFYSMEFEGQKLVRKMSVK